MSTLVIQSGPTDILEIDGGLISEGNTTETQVTSAPVEDGFSVADGVVSKPQTLKLECIVADYRYQNDPLGRDGKSLDTLAKLRAWQTAGTIVDVYTDGPSFLQYCITSVGYQRTTKATQLKISIALQAIRTVSTKWVEGKKVNKTKRKPAVAEKTSQGGDTDKKTNEAPSQSLLKRIEKWADR